MRRLRVTKTSAGLFGASAAIHLALGAAVARIEPEPEPEPVVISIFEYTEPEKAPEPPPEPPKPPPEPPKEEEVKPLEPPPEPPPVAEKPPEPPPEPPKPPPEPPKPPPKAPPREAKAPKAPKAPNPGPPTGGPGNGAPLDLGVTMGNGPGGLNVGGGGEGGEGGGGDQQGPAGGNPPKAVRDLVAKPANTKKQAPKCAEPPTKAKPLGMPKPAYPEAARTKGVSGKVRVELTVDKSGTVVRARVIEGLGHGLDEAALAAAKAAKFQAALECGKPVESTFVISVRFAM